MRVETSYLGPNKYQNNFEYRGKEASTAQTGKIIIQETERKARSTQLEKPVQHRGAATYTTKFALYSRTLKKTDAIIPAHSHTCGSFYIQVQ